MVIKRGLAAGSSIEWRRNYRPKLLDLKRLWAESDRCQHKKRVENCTLLHSAESCYVLPMPNDNNNPQFETAQYGTPSTASADRCFSCNQPIAGQYYRVNGKIACDACTNRLRNEQPSNSSGFMRGLLFGIGAAIVGLILYATFTIVTGFYSGMCLSRSAGW